MLQYRHLQLAKNADVVIARFVDQKLLDSLAVKVGEEMLSVADQKDCFKLLLNFSGVDHVASAILSRLLTLNRKMNQKGGKLRVCEISPELRSVFAWTVLTVSDTEAVALKAFATKG